MQRILATLAVLSVVATGAVPAHAGGVDRLDHFMKQTQSARGEFEQRIVNRERKVVQQSSGALAFQRPGKFRWSYVKPYEQLIVGDGARVWIYDRDLNQVTVRKRDGLEWVEAKPRDKESTFEVIRMGFGAQGLERMELTDSFGQTTLLRFTGLQSNPRLEAGLFTFTPPQGADVVGDK